MAAVIVRDFTEGHWRYKNHLRYIAHKNDRHTSLKIKMCGIAEVK